MGAWGWQLQGARLGQTWSNVVKACGLAVGACKWLPWVVRVVGDEFGVGVSGGHLAKKRAGRLPNGLGGKGACSGTPGRLQRLEIEGQVCNGVYDVETSW